MALFLNGIIEWYYWMVLLHGIMCPVAKDRGMTWTADNLDPELPQRSKWLNESWQEARVLGYIPQVLYGTLLYYSNNDDKWSVFSCFRLLYILACNVTTSQLSAQQNATIYIYTVSLELSIYRYQVCICYV